MIEGSYRNNFKDGRWTVYHQNGKVRINGYYIKQFRFDKFGIPFSLDPKDNQKKNGLWIYYDENGEIIKYETWKDGYEHGNFYEKHPDGSKSLYIYKDGNYLGKNNIFTKLLFKL